MITLFLKGLTDGLARQKPYKTLLSRIVEHRYPCEIEGPEGLYLALLISRVHGIADVPSLVVTPTEREAEALVGDLELVTDRAVIYPWDGTAPYAETESRPSISGRKIRILEEMLNSGDRLVVVPLRAFLTPVVPPDFLRENLLAVAPGDTIDPLELEQRLSTNGYLRVPQVSVQGEFALRGEVLDVFAPGADEATRVVFEFDTVEEIRGFSPFTQHSARKLERAVLPPVREVIWNEERLAELTAFLKKQKRVGDETYDLLIEAAEKGSFAGESLLFPLSFPSPASLVDYLPEGASLFLVHPEHIDASVAALQKEYRESYVKARKERNHFLPPPNRVLHDFEQLRTRVKKNFSFPAIKESVQESDRIRFSYEGPRSFFGNVAYLKEELARMKDAGYSITVFADTEAQAARIGHLLRELEVTILPEGISQGFTLPDLKIMAIQENEIFGRRQRRPKSVKTAKSEAIDTFVELNPGDFVVHVNYGIGRFLGIERVVAVGTERDYIKLEYAGEETIFTPIEQVNLIQRYIGQEGREPRLDKIGGKAWESRKSRVRKSVEDLAERLLALYSKRRTVRGFPFPEDTDWQLEFETGFPYEETEDQLRCIEEVKLDMEKPLPMDRLVCGDVGYGKTEVAMRAAFKAVSGGKQVAFLAPTTILTEQHYENFVDRFDRYPVQVRMISRFVSGKKQRTIIKEIGEGRADILIGTHRLLQRDVHFKNLGLLIVDEEQRFGVKDKERLKELKTNVDCLTLSATPIPRTLHMSLLKLRDMSLLTTAPYNRRPIETVIREFEEETVATAIRNEMKRGGQVYYLHNRVETLENIQGFIQKLVPEAIVEIAHGQMRSETLEEIMHRFIHGGFQVLAATTIIENGIDIPNVNTIIIDRADMYGISQLYQLRGRVGRSDRLAYAYLLYPGERALSEIAMKRLQIISDNTELGSGFKVALKDLEVRGAGNLLGRQQHGDILSVGFDMYIRLLDQAIQQLSDSDREESAEVYLELDYSGFIPDRYIREPVEKMEVYKKIASISTVEELEAVYAEIIDRFGPVPDEVQSLMSLAEMRILCRRLSIGSLREKKGVVEVEFLRIADVSIDKVMRLIKESNGRVVPDSKRPNVLKLQVGNIGLAEKSEYLREKLEALI